VIELRLCIRMTLLAGCCSALAQMALAAPPTVNCSGMETVDQFGQMKLDQEKVINECINKGFDPPVSWRPPPGKIVTSGGAGSILTHAQNAPDKPPRVAGAAPSVSNSRWGFSLKLPPWQGFPCQLPGGTSLCGGSGGGGGSSGGGGGNCPIQNDPAFGLKIPLGGSQTLTCGGAVPISGNQYSYSYMKNPTNIAIIDGFTMNIYRFSGGKFVADSTVNLPTFLCKLITDIDGNTTMQRWFDLRTPVPQIIAYNNSIQNFVIRLQQPDPSRQPDPAKPQFPKDDPGKPQASQYLDYDVPWFNPFDPDPDAPQERFLVLEAVNGEPVIPRDSNGNPDPNGCFEVDKHYINEPATINLVEFKFRNDAICDAETLYPNSASCPKNMLVALMDTPQLIFEPQRKADFIPIQGRPEFMAITPADGFLMMQFESTLRISSPGVSFVLPEGGTISLNNGKYLRMNGPATISSSGSSIKLDNGGQIESSSGTVLSTFGPGSTVSPGVPFPYSLRPNKKIMLPAGILMPTAPNGALRLPVTQP
jgi:hypothetical protein